jgi:branched-chain amino acid transport system permease protein
MSYLPCGTYFEQYLQDHKWWRTPFIKAKMALMVILVVAFPAFLTWMDATEWLSVAHNLNYMILAALGVQLLIGFCGQITLGHAAFVAVGAYCSSMMMLFLPWPQFMADWGLVYPLTMICAGVVAGLWSVLFGLPSARVKGFYLIMTTMAAQWITVPLVITQYVSRIGGRAHSFSLENAPMKIGPLDIATETVIDSFMVGPLQLGNWTFTKDMKIYYFSLVLVVLCLLAMGNLLRSKPGRAWIAIRDNDIAAETMGVNIVWYKLLAFFVAGFFAGIAGAFYISMISFVSPEHYGWGFSLEWVGCILIGGVGSIQGLVFGAAFWQLLSEFLKIGVDQVSALLAIFWPEAYWITTKIHFIKESVFGLAIIAFLIYEPNGLAYRYWQLKNYFNLWPFSYTGKGH